MTLGTGEPSPSGININPEFCSPNGLNYIGCFRYSAQAAGMPPEIIVILLKKLTSPVLKILPYFRADQPKPPAEGQG